MPIYCIAYAHTYFPGTIFIQHPSRLLADILQTINHGLGPHRSLTPHGFIVRKSFLSHGFWLGWLFECGANGGRGFGYVLQMKLRGDWREFLIDYIKRYWTCAAVKNHRHALCKSNSIQPSGRLCGVINDFPSLRKGERFMCAIRPESCRFLILTSDRPQYNLF